MFFSAAEAGENASTTETVRIFYEEHAENGYRPDESAASLKGESRSPDRADRVADAILVEARGPLKILDVGCSHGRRVNRLALAGHDVVGIDLAFAPLLRGEAMRRRVGVAPACFVRANLFCPPIGVGTADLVLATEVLDETGNPAAGVLALSSTLRTGGTMVVTAGAYRLPWFAAVTPAKIPAPPERSAHSLDEVCSWLDTAGIDPVVASDSGDPAGILRRTGAMGAAERLLRSFAWTTRATSGSILVAGTKRA